MLAVQDPYDEGNDTVVLAYCKVCHQTLGIPLNHSNSTFRHLGLGGLYKHTYIHQTMSSENEGPHALVLLLDQNYAVRRAEVTHLYSKAQSPADFRVKAYCPMCQEDLAIPINNLAFQQAIATLGYYKQVFVHGQPSHAVLVLIDEEKEVVRAEITSVDLAADLTFFDRDDFSYVLLESKKVPQLASIFESIYIFDQRSQTVINFFAGFNSPVTEIAPLVDEVISSPHHLQTASVLKDAKEHYFVLSEGKELCLVGIGLEKAYYPWLHLLAKILFRETEPLNTLGLEIVLKLMKKQQDPPKESVLYNLLFSSLYSVRFALQYEHVFDRMFHRLQKRCPNTAELFRPCALGQQSVLEVMNTDEVLSHFDEFLTVLAFVERRFRLTHKNTLERAQLG
ncbi:MAG: hypothetical protein ACFFC7_20635 [Candidatus Hermodarchaeota archaeon]